MCIRDRYMGIMSSYKSKCNSFHFNTQKVNLFLDQARAKQREVLEKKSILYNFDFDTGLPFADTKQTKTRYHWEPITSFKNILEYKRVAPDSKASELPFTSPSKRSTSNSESVYATPKSEAIPLFRQSVRLARRAKDKERQSGSRARKRHKKE
eukprot:TRINITY_DN2892_c0_g1_i17.p1 TRINITY_DN2892_c0_g1~~TRINITY_DN2892_c0_g1_i17.p1  ORF type:complete len:153 (+),score=7.68 TRINITY_DN2892_c0_g1_i17:77-535(+)